MIEDVIAQSHVLVDTLNFQDGTVALAALRTLSEGRGEAGPFAQLLGITFSEFGGGHCKAVLEVKHHLLNPHGIAHGGVTFSLADTVCGGAALSILGKPLMVTQDMHIRYHGPARPGMVVAQAEVIHHGRRTMTVHCRVTQNETLIASVTTTYALLTEGERTELVIRDT